ncbi:PREDICTED: homeobox-leucine zipper protein ATHB-52-like [Tarenaya hassleriana]|uniref:homeobox-leucine zipper protein ATHB-52-like n=1 Tax=Tarenaya hassleriana TaxID=28532 RepID=UPI00053C9D37|nr:PREDICTED: homeobox-leucine zipper protein ATHB-52-like [Tarenaya hassleriana]
MERSQTQTRNRRKRLGQDQIRVLEKSFVMNKKPEPEIKIRLANQLGLPPRQVAVWFQNKRARFKTRALELQHGSIMARLGTALADKLRLEREVKLLQEELEKSREQLSLLMTKHPVDGRSCEDGHDQVMEFDQLYACLVSSGHGSPSVSNWTRFQFSS